MGILDTPPVSRTELANTYYKKFVVTDDLPATGLISAHRGSGGDTGRPVAPEHTFSAYYMALAMGSSMVDVDCQVTSDNVLVAMHDATVDRTTAGTGNVSSFTYANLPPVYMPEVVGNGWAPEAVPTIDQILNTFGGRIVLTIEPKDSASIPAMAGLILSRGLERSVFMNTNSASEIAQIVSLGCRGHMYGCTTLNLVNAAVAAGAQLIEVPYNADPSLVTAAFAGGIKRVIAGPTSLRSEVAAMTAGIQGHVTDAPGYTNRLSGPSASVPALQPSAAIGRRGRGWSQTSVSGTEATATDWISTAGIRLRNGTNGGRIIRLGDVSGTPPTSGTLTGKFKMTTLPTTTSQRVYFRVFCPQESATAADGDTQGYVISLRANGQLNLWESTAGFTAANALGATPAGAALVAGTEYALKFEWTSTQVRLTRVDTGDTSGWVASTAWRSPYMYAGSTMANGVAVVTDLAWS